MKNSANDMDSTAFISAAQQAENNRDYMVAFTNYENAIAKSFENNFRDVDNLSIICSVGARWNIIGKSQYALELYDTMIKTIISHNADSYTVNYIEFILLGRASTLCALNDFVRAKETYETVIKINSQCEEAHLALQNICQTVLYKPLRIDIPGSYDNDIADVIIDLTGE
jgi:tetratricopeptide (TPR) repeat protein